MANSKYEYVRAFERPTALLPNTYMVVRIDGRGFHKFSTKYEFRKPNDQNALDLMNASASAVVKELPDIILAYGVSDEYSFVFDRSCKLFERREDKILTTIVSTFTSYYVYLWSSYFPDKTLSAPMPSFDGRVIQYPTRQNLRDYMSWRQVDCHINNLYNTTFWALVLQGGVDRTQAEEQLKGTSAAQKNDILFSRFKINYNNQPQVFRKGSVVYREYATFQTPDSELVAARPDGEEQQQISKTQKTLERKRLKKTSVIIDHCDIIKDDFWTSRSWLLSSI